MAQQGGGLGFPQHGLQGRRQAFQVGAVVTETCQCADGWLETAVFIDAPKAVEQVVGDDLAIPRGVEFWLTHPKVIRQRPGRARFLGVANRARCRRG